MTLSEEVKQIRSNKTLWPLSSVAVNLWREKNEFQSHVMEQRGETAA